MTLEYERQVEELLNKLCDYIERKYSLGKDSGTDGILYTEACKLLGRKSIYEAK